MVETKINNLLDIDDLVVYIGIKKKTVYNWIYSRKIPHYKLGRLVKFKRNEIDDWVGSKKVDVFTFED